jgi:CRISPR-associated protein Cas1
MILENPSTIKKENLRIFVKGYNWKSQKPENYHIDPKELDDLILTKPSTISTEIYKLKPDLNVLFFSRGNLIASIMPIDNLPKILKNEQLFNNLSKYKQKKLRWIFCKAVCSSRIKVISRLNEIRNNLIVKEALEHMRKLDRKLIKSKSREELMGIEGNIAKYFYHCLSEFSVVFDSNFRTRDRNSRDIINCLMNFGHTVLRNKIKYRLFLNGINPYHSFLHDNKRNQEYLTFDFAEFWIAYVDKLIFYALEKGIIKEIDIKDNLLNENAKKSIIKLIDERIPNEKIDRKIKEFIGYLKNENRLSWK